MTIEVANESGVDVDEQGLVGVARFVLDALGVSPLAELSVLLVDVEHMTDLHVRWMDLPGPTDVLSFAMDELDLRGSRGVAHASQDRPEQPGPVLLGDVVLCPEVAATQAVGAGHCPQDELELLCAHGILHILGYDHEEPDEHEEMFGLQGDLLLGWRAARNA